MIFENGVKKRTISRCVHTSQSAGAKLFGKHGFIMGNTALFETMFPRWFVYLQET